jgi:hypothetical protein
MVVHFQFHELSFEFNTPIWFTGNFKNNENGILLEIPAGLGFDF